MYRNQDADARIGSLQTELEIAKEGLAQYSLAQFCFFTRNWNTKLRIETILVGSLNILCFFEFIANNISNRIQRPVQSPEASPSDVNEMQRRIAVLEEQKAAYVFKIYRFEKYYNKFRP